MTFDLVNLTSFVTVFFTVAALAVVVLAGLLTTFFVRNHAARVQRHEGVAQLLRAPRSRSLTTG